MTSTNEDDKKFFPFFSHHNDSHNRILGLSYNTRNTYSAILTDIAPREKDPE